MNGVVPVLRFPGPLRALLIWRAGFVAILVTTAALGAPTPGRADGPLSDPALASVSVGSRAHDIILDGNFAYVATDKGLTILDLSRDPRHPVPRGSVLTQNCSVDPGACLNPPVPRTRNPVAKSQGLAKKGSYVYLAAGLAGMQVIDVSNPDSPRTIASAIALQLPLFRPDGAPATSPQRGKIYDIAVHPTADAAYAASYNGEVYVWNISNPAAPVLTQTLGVMLWGGGVCTTCVDRMVNHVENGTAYVTGVSTARDPLTGRVYVIGVDWGYAGFYIWDATDPIRLQFLGTHRLKVSMYRAELDLTRTPPVAHTLGAFWINSGLISVPLAFPPPNLFPPSAVTYCSTLGGLAPPAPASPTPPCSTTATCLPCGHAKMPSPLVGDGGGVGYSINGKYAFYVGGRGNGELAIVDVTDPDQLVKVASTPVGPMNLQLAEAAGIVARNDILYVAAGPLGVLVYEYPGLGSSPQ